MAVFIKSMTVFIKKAAHNYRVGGMRVRWVHHTYTVASYTYTVIRTLNASCHITKNLNINPTLASSLCFVCFYMSLEPFLLIVESLQTCKYQTWNKSNFFLYCIRSIKYIFGPYLYPIKKITFFSLLLYISCFCYCH